MYRHLLFVKLLFNRRRYVCLEQELQQKKHDTKIECVIKYVIYHCLTVCCFLLNKILTSLLLLVILFLEQQGTSEP